MEKGMLETDKILKEHVVLLSEQGSIYLGYAIPISHSPEKIRFLRKCLCNPLWKDIYKPTWSYP